MHQPLPQAFPEYSVVKRPQGTHEFRVETKNHFRSRNTSGSHYAGPFDYAFVLIFPVLGAVAWQMVHHWTLILGLLVSLFAFGYWKATRVLWESVIVLPSKDLQLEVHRGLPGRSMFVERWVIPASEISAVIINEGLYGWNVRYYLAVVTKVGEAQSLYVLYENQLPRMPILRDVYHNLQVSLFDA